MNVDPFRHWIIDDFTPAHVLTLSDVPVELPWIHYSNELESNKRTCNDLAAMPGDWKQLLLWLNSTHVANTLALLTGVVDLQPDPLLYGAGLHIADPGGHLNCHLDYALHECGLERRINLLLFLNRSWDADRNGGAFELYDASARRIAKRIAPRFNRAVIWEAGDLAYHGAERTADTAPSRITACAYFLAPPRPGTVRRRALFVPSR